MSDDKPRTLSEFVHAAPEVREAIGAEVVDAAIARQRGDKPDMASENAAANVEAIKTAEEIVAGDRVGIHVREVRLARALLRFEKVNALYRELLKSKGLTPSAVRPIEVTPGMVVAGQEELQRQRVALDPWSPPLFLKPVFEAMLKASVVSATASGWEQKYKTDLHNFMQLEAWLETYHPDLMDKFESRPDATDREK